VQSLAAHLRRRRGSYIGYPCYLVGPSEAAAQGARAVSRSGTLSPLRAGKFVSPTTRPSRGEVGLVNVADLADDRGYAPVRPLRQRADTLHHGSGVG